MKGCVDALQANYPSIAAWSARSGFAPPRSCSRAVQPPRQPSLLDYGGGLRRLPRGVRARPRVALSARCRPSRSLLDRGARRARRSARRGRDARSSAAGRVWPARCCDPMRPHAGRGSTDSRSRRSGSAIARRGRRARPRRRERGHSLARRGDADRASRGGRPLDSAGTGGLRVSRRLRRRRHARRRRRGGACRRSAGRPVRADRTNYSTQVPSGNSTLPTDDFQETP